MKHAILAAAFVTGLSGAAQAHDISKDLETLAGLEGRNGDLTVDGAIMLYFIDRKCVITPANAGSDTEPMKYLAQAIQLDEIDGAELAAGALDHPGDHGEHADAFVAEAERLKEIFIARWQNYMTIGVISPGDDGNSLTMNAC